MGTCASKARNEALQKVKKAMGGEKPRNEFESVASDSFPLCSVLVMGGPGSGKSTAIKQYRAIYGDPITIQERETYKALIHKQCIDQMQLALSILVDMIALFLKFFHDIQDETESQGTSLRIPDDVQQKILHYSTGLTLNGFRAAEYIQNQHDAADILNYGLATAIKTLWNEQIIREIYEKRNIKNIADSSAYFWNKLDILSDPMYIPDECDILRVCDTHSLHGITETFIRNSSGNNNREIRFIDLNGLHSQWRKWTHCFQDITAVVFVISLSCYDEILYLENQVVNAMVHQLEMFTDFLDDPFLSTRDIIIIPSKMDLFLEKIKRVPLQICPLFSDYVGEGIEEAVNFIRQTFTSLVGGGVRSRAVFEERRFSLLDVNYETNLFDHLHSIIVHDFMVQAGLASVLPPRSSPATV